MKMFSERIISRLLYFTMSRDEKTDFTVNNEITNAATGDENSHSVNSSYGGNLINCGTVFILQNQKIAVSESTKSSLSKVKRTQLEIKSRGFWRAANPNLEMEELQKPVKMIVICHTVTENEENTDQVKLICKSMQQKHLKEGFGDIIFNFMIGCDGEVYEGRGFNIVGAHTLDDNKTSLGIGFIGDFRKKAPPDASIKKCQELLKMGVEAGHVAADYDVNGICDLEAHEGPGKMLLEKIPLLSHKVVIRKG